ncbi:MAG TPA: alpha-amylase family glycosyl hydrolase [Paucimonas sp.]|nr:alpha-amylase family glycosyl hydrolase [Paucimonas sp.]
MRLRSPRILPFGSLLSGCALAVLLAACGSGGGGTAATPAAAAAPNDSGTALPAVDVGAVAAADPGSTLPEGWQHGAFMEIYVRGYQDSDGDGHGDLRGLTQRLDYLKDLGIKGIWLMPVTQSQDRDHGYAVADYRAIEADYGTLADFDEFVKQAHARGIGVVIDYVMNHSAARHPLFLHARAAPGNAYRSWYVWRDSAPGGWRVFGGDPWRATANGAYFAAFWDQMPDFNLRNTDVVAWHKSNLRFWLNRGVDGFRFDAVGNLVENGPSAWQNQPENYALMNDIRATIAGYQRRYLVCEAPDDPLGFAAPAACGSAFAFGHQHAIVDAARGSPTAIAAVADYFKNAPAGMATMASNHDSFAGARLWDRVNGDLAQYKLVAAAYLLQPGTPFIYYGEEIGMAGGLGLAGDPALRAPMSWSADPDNAGFTRGKPFRALAANAAAQNVAAQANDARSLLSFYKAMLALRNTRPSLARGSYEGAFAAGGVLGFRRKLAGETTLVLINYGTAAASAELDGLGANATLRALHPVDAGSVGADAAGQARIALAPQSVLVYSLQP